MATINLTWTASNPVPTNGYRIKYWPTSSPASITTVSPNVTGTSYSIVNLTAGVSYSGTIEASCAGGAYSSAVAWSVTATSSGGGGNTGGGGTTPTYLFYAMREIDCATGVVTNPEVVVAVNSSYTPLIKKYYRSLGNASSVYYNFSTQEVPEEIAPILSTFAAYSTRADACNAVFPES